VLRALAAQGLALAVIFGLAWLLAPRMPFWFWPLAQGGAAAFLAYLWGLNRWWLIFQVALPFALVWQLGHPVPAWIYPLALLGLVLVFGGGLLTRVPLYNSSHAAWKALLDRLPLTEGLKVADLGAGLGGPLSYLARQRPDAHFVGVEASPVVWLLAWLRTWSLRSRCRIRFGSLWKLPLGEFHVVYAFLSPAPMPALWKKTLLEMAPGTLLISNTFQIPGVIPETEIRLPDRPDARLLVYRIPGDVETSTSDSQEALKKAENT
jgi:hypothetical protein